MIRRAALAASALAAAITVVAPSAADAGVYTVHSCRAPDGERIDARAWVSDARSAGRARVVDACATGGSLSVELKAGVAHPANDYVRAIFSAPPDTEIRDYDVWRSIRLSNVYHLWFQEYGRSGFVARETCFAENGCTARGAPNDPLNPGNLVGARSRTGLTKLDFLLSCGHVDTGSASCSSASPTGSFQIHRSDVTLLDRYAPQLAAQPTGPLVSSGGRALSGVQEVRIAATDRGGGVYQALLEVDGRVVAASVLDRNAGRCRVPFTLPRPCKPSAAGTLALNTAALADGRHSLRVLVTDATATNTVTWGPIQIETANSACARSPKSNSFKVRARVAGRKAAVVRRGRRLRVSGVLRQKGGKGVAGASVCVLVKRADRGAPTQSSVTTSQSGRFSLSLRARASQRIWVVHRTAAGAASTSVSVRVRAPVRFAASPNALRNGEVVNLKGRVLGRPFPRKGAIVEIQVRKGDGWQTFATTRSRDDGRYHYRYRFTQTRGVQAYTFRARVPDQPRYPFAPGGSRPVQVVVSG